MSAYLLYVERTKRLEVSPPKSAITFQPSERNKEPCRAVYYGLGTGDGAYNPHCFKLQVKLSDAAGVGNVERIKELLRDGANADSYAGDSFPPLHIAALNGHTNAVRLLLDNGANINRKYTLNGTPLFAAVYGNHADVVSVLLSHGADVKMSNGDETALQVARKSKYQDIVTLLEMAEAEK